MSSTTSVPNSIDQAINTFHSSVVITLAGSLVKLADELLKKRSNVTYAQVKVLAMVATLDLTSQNTIAECLSLTPPAVSRLTESLVDKKLLQRDADPENRRKNRLRITPKGQALLTESVKLFAEIEKTIYAEVRPGELKKFKEIAKQLLTATLAQSDKS